nr:RNA polymerase II subunit 7 [Paratrimastix eleionoma]
MFFLMNLQKNLELPPRFFGPKLRTTLITKLRAEVTNSCTGRYGYIIAVISVDEIGEGRIRAGSGLVSFPIKYQAIVFRPFRGEVIDAVVSQVNKFGFFVFAGPLRVFITSKLTPPEFHFDSNANPPCYINNDGAKIQREEHVRIRIVGCRVDATEIACIGTMKEDYLGLTS